MVAKGQQPKSFKSGTVKIEGIHIDMSLINFYTFISRNDGIETQFLEQERVEKPDMNIQLAPAGSSICFTYYGAAYSVPCTVEVKW